MLGRTSVRALSVLDVCSGYGQKQALDKTQARIRETEAAILENLRQPPEGFDLRPLLLERKKLYQRLAWLKLDISSAAEYHASARRPTVKTDPVFAARFASYGYTSAPSYQAAPETYDLLRAEGALPPLPQVVLFPEPNYAPADQGAPVVGAVANWAKPIGSLSVAPGAAVTLFSEPDFWGDWHVITADIPNLCSSSRLSLKPGQPVGSLRVYSLCNLPYTGGWIISLEPGGYLSARQSEVLRVWPSAGPWETFRLDVVEALGRDRARVLLSVDDVTPSPEFIPDAVRSGGVYLLTEERARGYRRFTLTDPAGRPVVLNKTMLRLGAPGEDPVLMTRLVKVAKNESEVGLLQLGEAALYENPNYWGRAWVMHQTYGEFPLVAGLNDVVSSVRLGPYTGITLYDLTRLGTGPIAERERLDSLNTEHQRLLEKLRSLPTGGSFWDVAWETAEQGILNIQIAVIEQEIMTLAAQLPDPAVKQDITEDVPNLAEAPSGANAAINLDNAASSIRLWTMIPPEEANLEYSCTLSQDYRRTPDGKTEEILAYRTTLKFDQRVEQATIAATDATTIESGGMAYEVDEDRSVTLDLPLNKQLVLISEARDLCTPALKIRTPAMPAEAWAVIYPDREVHERLATLEPDELWNAEVRQGDTTRPSAVEPARTPLIDRSKFNQNQIANAQKAIQSAMSSIAYVEPGVDEVVASARFVSARAARDAAWMLDFGRAAPLAQAAPGVPAAPPPPAARLEYRPLDDQQLGAVLRDTLEGTLQQGAFDWLEDAAEWVWDKVIVAPVNYIWDHAKDFGEEVVNGLKDFGLAAWGTLKDFGDKLVAFLVNAAGDIGAFVLDTVDKVVAVVKTVVEKIVSFVGDAINAIKKFLEFLAFLFDWGDILRTQRLLMEMFNDFLNQGQQWIRTNRPILKQRLTRAGDEFRRAILPGQPDLVHDMDGDSVRMPDAVKEIIKVAGEVQEKIDWVMDKVMSILPSPQLELFTLSAADRQTLRAFSWSGCEDMVGLVETTAGGIVDIFDDGFSPQQMLAGVLRLFNALMDRLIHGAIELVDGLLAVAEILLRVLSSAFNHEWYIPILSEIYELLTDQKFSFLSSAALIMAIPITLATKLTIGERPFADGSLAFAVPNLAEKPLVVRDAPRADSSSGAPIMSSGEAGVPAAEGPSPADVRNAYFCALSSGTADTICFVTSAFLDAIPPDKAAKAGALVQICEMYSLLLGAYSFVMSLPGSIVWDAFDEYQDKPDDVRIAAGFQWGIEAALFLVDILSAATSPTPCRARRSDSVWWVVSSVLAIGHLTAVSCLCAMDDEMNDADKAAACLVSIPGPLALLHNEWCAKSKYVWVGCAAILVAGNLGGAAGSITSMIRAAP